MLIAFPDEAITQIRGPREGWTVHEGFDPGARDANEGGKDSGSLWLLQKMGGNEAQLAGIGEGWFLQDQFLCPEATIHVDLGHCTSCTALPRDSPTLPLLEPTTFPYTEYLQLFYLLILIVFSGIYVVVATRDKKILAVQPVLQILGFKGMKGQLMLTFPLAGQRERLTWACSRQVTQTQVLAAAEQGSPCVGLIVYSAAHKLWL